MESLALTGMVLLVLLHDDLGYVCADFQVTHTLAFATRHSCTDLSCSFTSASPKWGRCPLSDMPVFMLYRAVSNLSSLLRAMQHFVFRGPHHCLSPTCHLFFFVFVFFLLMKAAINWLVKRQIKITACLFSVPWFLLFLNLAALLLYLLIFCSLHFDLHVHLMICPSFTAGMLLTSQLSSFVA